MPSLGLFLDDLGNPSPRKLGRALGVTERTVRRWIVADQAPRPVMLALYWLTRWGISAVDADAYNAACNSAGLARALGHEAEALRREVARLVTIGDFGCANMPTMQPRPGATVLQFPRAQPARA